MEPPQNFEWIKASASAGLNACVELAPHGDVIALRDSKNPGVVLNFTQLEMVVFFGAVMGGEFDHLVAGGERAGA